MAHARGLAKVPATANLVLAYGKRWRMWSRRVAVHLRVFLAHRITNRGPTDKEFCRDPNQGLSEPLLKFQLRRSCFRVFSTREPVPTSGSRRQGTSDSEVGPTSGGQVKRRPSLVWDIGFLGRSPGSFRRPGSCCSVHGKSELTFQRRKTGVLRDPNRRARTP